QAAVVDAQAPRFEGTLDDDGDLVDVERLGQVVVGALLHRGDGDALGAVRGEQEDRQRRIARGDVAHQLEAIHARHRQIGDDGLRVVEQRQRLGTRARAQDLVPAFGEDLAQREQNTRLVVDEQYRTHARASIMAARGAGSGAVVTGLPG